jgi:hypothetical protein
MFDAHVRAWEQTLDYSDDRSPYYPFWVADQFMLAFPTYD